MRRTLLTLPARRGLKWVFLVAWLVGTAAIVAGNLPTKFDEAQSNESTSFLPGNAESTAALEATEEIQGDELLPLVIVYQADDGRLTEANLERIETDRQALNADLPPRTSAYSEPVPSEDGTAALLEAQIRANGEGETITTAVDQASEQVESTAEPGVETAVTGGAGLSADAIDVFDSINGTLLLATAGIVFLLLLIVYRSPVFWFFPLFAVALAELATRGVGYGLTEIGVTVNGQSAGILPVLVFGAGTDYALLLVARYREELRVHENKHEAMAEALRRAGPAILASGLTVIAALLCLTLADVEGTAGLGPIGATGIAIAMVSMLTLLPATLVIAGRWVFWPFVPHVGDSAADETHGAWRRIGEWIGRGPRRVWIGATFVLLLMTLGWLNADTGLTQTSGFRDDVESVRGQELIAGSFPAGASAPADLIVPDADRVPAVEQALAELDSVDDVVVAGRGPPGVLLQVTLSGDPYSTTTYDQIPGLREAVKEAGGEDVLLGGPSAVERDLRVAAARDSKLIPPIALAVVLVILMILLRALVAPLVLIGTVILSFAAALGVGFIVFDVVFGFSGSDPSLPLFAFIFLVALGVDYNIFLMARVREETLRRGPREGVLRGLAVTGGVITSAGIVLAGTFSALAVLPLVFLTELGFVVAFGVLLDTFLVRSILVPALALDLDRRTWWPSALSKADAPAPDAADPSNPSPRRPMSDGPTNSGYSSPAVAGSGAIALGLAASASSLGEVTVLARSDTSAWRAEEGIEKLCAKVEGGDHTRVRVTTSPADIEGSDLIVEAIVEDEEAKAAMLASLGEICPDADLATTTSSLGIAELGKRAGVPERFYGLHVFNPVPRMELIELCLPAALAPGVGERARAFCGALNKHVVEVPDEAGFVVNRLLFPYLFDAVRLMDELGLEPAEVDACMSKGAGQPMGPLQLLDFVGLDVSVAIGEKLHAASGKDDHAPPPRLAEMIAAGKLGRKSGSGFYEY